MNEGFTNMTSKVNRLKYLNTCLNNGTQQKRKGAFNPKMHYSKYYWLIALLLFPHLL